MESQEPRAKSQEPRAKNQETRIKILEVVKRDSFTSFGMTAIYLVYWYIIVSLLNKDKSLGSCLLVLDSKTVYLTINSSDEVVIILFIDTIFTNRARAKLRVVYTKRLGGMASCTDEL